MALERLTPTFFEVAIPLGAATLVGAIVCRRIYQHLSDERKDSVKKVLPYFAAATAILAGAVLYIGFQERALPQKPPTLFGNLLGENSPIKKRINQILDDNPLTRYVDCDSYFSSKTITDLFEYTYHACKEEHIQFHQFFEKGKKIVNPLIGLGIELLKIRR